MGLPVRISSKAGFTFLFTLIFSLMANMASAWGPFTHAAISKMAYRTEEGYEGDFVKASHSPDMVSFWHIVMKDSRYDFAHNLLRSDDGHTILDVDHDHGESQTGIPMFGKKILKAYSRTKHPSRFTLSDKYFAYGWIGHQLADRDAHGINGYASFHSLFGQFPLNRLPNHGAAELIVDAAEYEKDPTLANSLSVPFSASLVHEAGIRFFNDVKYYDSSSNLVRSIKRSDIINCSQGKRLARLWAKWLAAYRYVVLLTAKSRSFPEAEEYYSDYIVKYNRSVEEVAAFLENPTYEVAASRPFTSYFASLFNRFKSLFRSQKVQAEEAEESQQLPETLYYTFVNDVAQEAETLGALQTTEQIIVADPNVTGAKSYEFSTDIVNEEGFQQALTSVINRDLAETNPLEKRLWAKFMEGLYLRSDLSFREIVDRAQDFTPPSITNQTPGDGSFINETRPALYAIVADDPLGIGLDPGSLEMKVDGVSVAHGFIPEMNMLLYSPPTSLADGEHSVIIEAEDKADNHAASSWSFTIDTVPPLLLHQVQNKIINLKKRLRAEVLVSASEGQVTYYLEVFRIKDTLLDEVESLVGRVVKGEKVFTETVGEDLSMISWDGKDNDGQLVANGVYTMRITGKDRAGNETSFEELVNVNNEVGEDSEVE
jgi:hypothetical protein